MLTPKKGLQQKVAPLTPPNPPQSLFEHFASKMGTPPPFWLACVPAQISLFFDLHAFRLQVFRFKNIIAFAKFAAHKD